MADLTVTEKLKSFIKTMPGKPGVYQFIDRDGKIIYVGKAKHLKNRVSSYFTNELNKSAKLLLLVRRIDEIRYIVVKTELDALLLENNLIKKFQPRYNVQLKDDKSFPWICIKNEPFPRVFSTRQIVKDGSQYFGPYASVSMMNTVLELIRQLYTIRTCHYKLTQENIRNLKFRRCLEYHIGNCLGPCEGLQSETAYDREIDEIKQIIKGNISVVSNHLKDLMHQYAAAMEFEKAHLVKEKLTSLDRYQSRSVIVHPTITDLDVYAILDDEHHGYINYLKVNNGAIIQAYTIELKKKLNETKEELLIIAIADFRTRFNSTSKEIIVPFELPLALEGIKTTIPQRGDKKSLLDLSLRNAGYYKLEMQKQRSLVDPNRHSNRILQTMQKDLRMQEPPVHMECFDNSNIQGDTAVAALVVFKNARPAKQEYRHYNIKTVTGPDDYASMEEVVYRRYKRLLQENLPLPQLIVIDGGKGQLHAAVNSLEKLQLRGKIAIIGIAKKLEEIYYPDDPVPLYIDKKSETLKTIQHIRDEAHRFGIAHHRKKKVKESIGSKLTEIDGIGEGLSEKLLSEYRSVAKIRQASKEELISLLGPVKGTLVFDHFQQTENNT